MTKCTISTFFVSMLIKFHGISSSINYINYINYSHVYKHWSKTFITLNFSYYPCFFFINLVSFVWYLSFLFFSFLLFLLSFIIILIYFHHLFLFFEKFIIIIIRYHHSGGSWHVPPCVHGLVQNSSLVNYLFV